MLVIEIIDYPVYSRLGYFPQERLVGQEILVSLKAKFKPDFGPKDSDDLHKTLDYGKLTTAIDKQLQDKEIKLVETACHILGEALLKEFWMIQSLDISIEKTMFPRGIARGAQIKIHQVFERRV